MKPMTRTKEEDCAVKMSVMAVLRNSPMLCPTITCRHRRGGNRLETKSKFTTSRQQHTVEYMGGVEEGLGGISGAGPGILYHRDRHDGTRKI